jgi:hypothetical protein
LHRKWGALYGLRPSGCDAGSAGSASVGRAGPRARVATVIAKRSLRISPTWFDEGFGES